jgi:Domain of unknown function (DUF4832)
VTWTNKGVAPAYLKYNLYLKFINKNDATIKYDVNLSNSFDPAKWLPGDTKQNADFTLPGSLPLGTYKLQIYLQRYISQSDVSNIDLGFNLAADKGGRVFEIGEMEIK